MSTTSTKIANRSGSLNVLCGYSKQLDPAGCMDEILAQIDQPGLSGVIFFCSSGYDLERLGPEIAERFSCPILGCTTSGEISSLGYTSASMVAMSIASEHLKMHNSLITQISDYCLDDANRLAMEIGGKLTFSSRLDPELDFGLLLIDGLSMMEEQLVANLHRALNGVNLVGGSAGDDLNFSNTHVYHDGSFLENAAVLSIFETTLPFRTFKMQHFIPTEKRLIITRCDPSTRTVTEINGGPAAVEYAAAVGIEFEELTPMIFAAHPVMLRIGGEYFIRSIQKVNEDRSLTFYCSIDNGMVLRVAQGVDFISTLQGQMSELQANLPDMQMVIGFDCILRRLEILDKEIQQNVSDILTKHNFIGFSTYGEQFNSVHVNQTLTGVAIGGKLHE